jgi:hypothetical protein
MKNYVKQFEEENGSLIKTTRRRMEMLKFVLIGVCPLVMSALLTNKTSMILVKNGLSQPAYWFSFILTWCVFMLVFLIFYRLLSLLITEKLKLQTKLFADNELTENIVEALNNRFGLNLNDANIIRKSIKNDVLIWFNLNYYGFKGYENIFLSNPVYFDSNNINYKLHRIVYENTSPFKFNFDITHPDGRFEENIAFKLS